MDHEEFLKTLIDNLTSKTIDDIKFAFLISEVGNGRIKFLSIVEALHSTLTDENLTLREKGIDFLSKIITHMPTNLFNSMEITVVVNFYCNCLKEHHSFVPATLRALSAVVQMENTSKEDVCKIVGTLFQNLSCSSQLWTDRFSIYNILHRVVKHNCDEMKSMGSEFVHGLISFVEGETDPKCLLMVFNLLQAFISKFELGHFSEELFELLSCYFPIDFNAAIRDDTLITREDLVDGLFSCLTANETFCEQCLPMISEKLSSNLKVAKLDSYKLLQIVCGHVGVSPLVTHLKELWNNLERDMIPGNDKEVCQAALSSLTSIISLLSVKDAGGEFLSTFVQDITNCVKSLVGEVTGSVFQPAMRVLEAVSDASEKGTWKMLNFLQSIYQVNDVAPAVHLRILLPCFLPILKNCCKHIMGQDNLKMVEQYKGLLDLYLTSAESEDSDLRKVAFSSIIHVIPIHCEDLQQKLSRIIVDNIKTRDDVALSEEFTKMLRKVGEFHPKKLQSALLSSTNFPVDPGLPYADNLLMGLSYLADLPFYTHIVVPMCLNYALSRSNGPLGLENLLRACKLSKDTGSVEFCRVVEEHHNVSSRLLLWWSSGGLEEASRVRLLCEILALIVRQQQMPKQQEIVERVILGDIFWRNRKDGVVVLEAVLGSVLPEVKIPNSVELMNELLVWALRSTEPCIRLSSCRLLASLVNKASEISAAEMLKYVLESIAKELRESTSDALKDNCGYLFTWMMKGIILRGKPMYEESIDKWFELLGRKDIGGVAAEHFHILFEDDELYLNWESHCNIRVLYRQRFFDHYPKLLKLYETSDDLVKQHYLMALCQMLRGLPVHLIQTNISGVMVVLIQCLKSDKRSTLLTALNILLVLLEKKEKILMDHVGTFVPKLLGLASSHVSMDVRMNSLKCLFFYASYPTYTLLPLRNKVTTMLQSCLDDKKRMVRKEAVRARCRWFLVGAPGEDVLD